MQTKIINSYLSQDAIQGYSCHTLFIQPYYEAKDNLKRAIADVRERGGFNTQSLSIKTVQINKLNSLVHRVKLVGIGLGLSIPFINSIILLALRIFNHKDETYPPPIAVDPIQNNDVEGIFFTCEREDEGEEQNSLLSGENSDKESIPFDDYDSCSAEERSEEDSLSDENGMNSIFPHSSFDCVSDEDSSSNGEYSESDEFDEQLLNEIDKSFASVSDKTKPLIFQVVDLVEIVAAKSDQPIEHIISAVVHQTPLQIIFTDNDSSNDEEEEAKLDLKIQTLAFLLDPIKILKDAKASVLTEDEILMSAVRFRLHLFQLNKEEKRDLETKIFFNLIENKLSPSYLYLDTYLPTNPRPVMENLQREIEFFTQKNSERVYWKNEILMIYLKNFLSIFVTPYIQGEDPCNPTRPSLMNLLKAKIALFDPTLDFSLVEKNMLKIYIYKQLDFIASNQRLTLEEFQLLREKIISILQIDFPSFENENPFESKEMFYLYIELQTLCTQSSEELIKLNLDLLEKPPINPELKKELIEIKDMTARLLAVRKAKLNKFTSLIYTNNCSDGDSKESDPKLFFHEEFL